MNNVWKETVLILLTGMIMLCPAAETPSYQMDIFPLNFMNGQEYTIAENLPAVLKVRAWAVDTKAKKRFGNQIPVLILETPDFLTLTDAALQGITFQPWHQLKISSRKTVRNGQNYNHYEVPFFFSSYWNNRLGVGQPHNYNIFCLYLKSKSAKDAGVLYAKIRFGKEDTPEKTYRVRAIPSVQPLKKGTRRFEALIPGIAGQETDLNNIVRAYTGYWTGLSRKSASYVGMNWKNAYVKSQLSTDALLGSGKQFLYIHTPENFRPDAGIRWWQGFVQSGRVPKLIDPNGKINGDPRATPAWYLVDDPEKLYEKYITDGCRMYRKYYPQIRRFYWDYEPGVNGMDRKGLERFAQKMKLSQVPTLAEVNTGKFRMKWFYYMVDLHQQHLEKVIRIFRKELPGKEFWICTDNLHAPKKDPSYWCAVECLRADQVVDGHLPMIYYAGKRYFDDVRFNRSLLRKPIIVLNDPAEMMKRFFDQYTPKKIQQNIVAAAALGCRGWGTWPDLTLSGLYFKHIRDAYSQVSQAEDFYFGGRRCDSVVKIQFKNIVEREFQYGSKDKKKVIFPDYSADLRYTLHQKNGEYLLTVFNYHDTRDMFIEPVFAGKIPSGYILSGINDVNYGPYKTGITVKIPPSGVKILKLGKTTVSSKAADADRIRQELEKNIRDTVGDLKTEPIVKDGASASWRIPSGNKLPMLMLKNPAGQQILIDVYGTQKQIIYWHNTVEQRPLGGFFLFDQTRIAGPYPFQLKKIDVGNGSASACFEYVFKTPDAGGDFDYQDLTVTQRFTIGKTNEFLMSYTVLNPSQNTMKLGFRIRNQVFHQYQEIRIGNQRIVPGPVHTSLLFMQKDTPCSFLSGFKRQAWNGETVMVKTKARTLKIKASDFAGIYIWNGAAGSGFTVEPVTSDFTLKPGEKKTFNIVIQF